jgi:hypothetical protein
LITGTPVDTKRAAFIGMCSKNKEIPRMKPTPDSTCMTVIVAIQIRRLARCHRTMTA